MELERARNKNNRYRRGGRRQVADNSNNTDSEDEEGRSHKEDDFGGLDDNFFNPDPLADMEFSKNTKLKKLEVFD